MKARWMIAVLLLGPLCLAAKVHYTEKQVVSYAKTINVAKLDPTLPSQRLEDWLQSGPARLYTVTWETSDCNLKYPPSPAPLCVQIRFLRRHAGGWVIIKVGTIPDGVKGEPQLKGMLIGPLDGNKLSDKLSDVPRLLEGALSVPNDR